MTRCASLSLLVTLLFCATGTARADRKVDAYTAELGGDRAFAKATYQDALDAYNASFTRYPKPHLLVRIGDCQRLLDRPADALYNYEKYLAKVLHGPERKRVRRYVVELRPKVAALRAAAAVERPVVEVVPAPQAQDPEAVPMSPQELARKRKQVDIAVAHSEVVSAARPVAIEPPPPGFDPANYVRDPSDPQIAPPPARVYPAGYKPPVYQRWWPWTILGAGVAAGVAIGLGLAFGLPRFHSELPAGGPQVQGLGMTF